MRDAQTHRLTRVALKNSTHELVLTGAGKKWIPSLKFIIILVWYPFISGRPHLWSAATGTLLVSRARTATGQRSFAATCNRLPLASTTVTGPVGERLQAGTEDAPVLDRLAPLRRLLDSGAGYKISRFAYLRTFIKEYLNLNNLIWISFPRHIIPYRRGKG